MGSEILKMQTLIVRGFKILPADGYESYFPPGRNHYLTSMHQTKAAVF